MTVLTLCLVRSGKTCSCDIRSDDIQYTCTRTVCIARWTQHVNGFPECNFIFPIAPQSNEMPAVFTLLPLQNAHVHPLRRIFYANANAMIVVNHNKQKDQSRNAIVNKKNIRRFSSMRSISRGQDILFQYSYSWVNAEHLPPHRAYIRE